MRALTLAALALVAVGCSGPLSGTYEYTRGYGYEFDGSAVYIQAGADIARGTYTVDGDRVRICLSIACTELRLTGDCLVNADGARYCKG